GKEGEEGRRDHPNCFTKQQRPVRSRKLKRAPHHAAPVFLSGLFRVRDSSGPKNRTSNPGYAPQPVTAPSSLPAGTCAATVPYSRSAVDVLRTPAPARP